MAAEVVIPPHVEAELARIGDHVALDDRQAALRLMTRLQEKCPSLAEFPFMGRRFGDSYRVIVSGSGRYLVFCRVDEAGERVVIVAILHGARHYDPELLMRRDRPEQD